MTDYTLEKIKNKLCEIYESTHGVTVENSLSRNMLIAITNMYEDKICWDTLFITLEGSPGKAYCLVKCRQFDRLSGNFVTVDITYFRQDGTRYSTTNNRRANFPRFPANTVIMATSPSTDTPSTNWFEYAEAKP